MRITEHEVHVCTVYRPKIEESDAEDEQNPDDSVQGDGSSPTSTKKKRR